MHICFFNRRAPKSTTGEAGEQYPLEGEVHVDLHHKRENKVEAKAIKK